MTTLLALSSSSAVGWAVAFHLADEHHHGGSAHHARPVGVDMVLHGHAHDDGTPAHGHAFLTSAPAPIPAKRELRIAAMAAGDALDLVVALSSRGGFLASRGPTHDPPPRRESPSVLRI